MARRNFENDPADVLAAVPRELMRRTICYWACAFFATQIFPALGIDVVEVVQNSSVRLGPRASGGPTIRPR